MTNREERDPVDTSYDPEYFKPLFAIEERHFWFRARNHLIETLVRQLTTHWDVGYRVLEVGCGTGNVLRVLEQTADQGVVVGMDLYGEGLRFARSRNRCPLIQGDVHAPPFHEPFQLIGLFDVLEHLPNDLNILRALFEMLDDGGVLLLTVPAHMSLWSYFDEASHHQRRYAMSELCDKLNRAGYQVEYVSHYMSLLFPLVWLGRQLAGWLDRRPASDQARVRDLATNELRIVPIINEVLLWLLSFELPLVTRRSRIPLGTSIVAIARK